MITRDLWRLSHPEAPLAASVGPLATIEEWRDRDPMRRGVETYVVERVPCCGCCGDEMADIRQRGGSIVQWPNGQVRCDRHHDRNPCAIEGCKRSTSAPKDRRGVPFIRDDQWLCSEHWRRFVPPRSLRRRAYRAFWRKAKRAGATGGGDWPDDLERQYWRFWDQLIATARTKASGGTLDEQEINRLFGWDEPKG